MTGGDLTTSGTHIYNGNAVVEGNANVPGWSVDNGTIVNGAENFINWDFAESYLKGLSADLAKMTPTGTSAYPYSTMLVSGDGTSDLQIINVDGNDWSKASDFTFLNGVNDAPANATYVFNVSGTELSINNGMNIFNALGESYDNVLFNFYEATALEISSIHFQGSILAPLADITTGWASGQITGTVIAKSFSGRMGFNHLPFEATIDPAPATPVPEPGTLMLLICGLLFLASRMRGPFKGLRLPVNPAPAQG